MREKSIMGILNFVYYASIVLYINIRNIISEENYLWFGGCFIISTVCMLIIGLLDLVNVDNKELKIKIKIVFIVGGISYLMTFFFFHILNYPKIFTGIIICLFLISFYLLNNIYRLNNDESILYSFIYNRKEDGEEYFYKEDLGKLKNIRNYIFLLQFFNISDGLLLEYSGINIGFIIFLLLEYTVLFYLIKDYFNIVSRMKLDKEVCRNTIRYFLIFILIKSLYFILKITVFNGFLAFAVMVLSIVPISRNIDEIESAR